MLKLRTSALCGWTTILLCLMVLLGWQFNIPLWTRWLPSAPTTMPATTLLLLLLSISLIILNGVLQKGLSENTIWYARAFASLSFIAAFWLGLKYIIPLGNDIELLIMKSKVLAQKGQLTGRSSPRTIITTILIATSLLTASFSFIRITNVFAITTLIIPWIALIGYAGLATPFYSYLPESGIGMSPITLTGFILLAVGVISLHPGTGLTTLFNKNSSAFTLIKLVIPVVLIIPLLLNWLINSSLQSKWLSPVITVASGLGVISFLSTVLIMYAAHTINLKEREKEVIFQKLQESEANYHQLINDVEDYAILRLDPTGKITVWNKGADKTTQYHEHEAIQNHFSFLFTEEDQDAHKPRILLETALLNGRVETEGWRKKKDGSVYWVNAIITALFDANRNLVGFVKVSRDLTKQKESAELLANSERRFRKLLESTPDAMVIVNEKGIITFTNTLMESLFGFSRKELLGEPVELLIPQHLSINHVQHRTEYLKHPQSRMMGSNLKLKATRKDGSEFPVEISLSTISTEAGNIEVAAAIRDITERNRHEEQLQRSIKNMELSQEIGAMGYYEGNIEEDIFTVSDNYKKLFGLSKNVNTRKEMEKLVDPQDRVRINEEFNRCIQNKKTFRAEYKVINPSTSAIMQVRNVCYFTFIEDRPQMAIGLKQDITPFSNARDAIENLNRDLISSNKELEAFSYSVSHDLRAPLRAITGFANKLIRTCNDQLNDEGKRITNIIINNTHKMGQLIDDILAFSRLTRENINIASVNIEEIFKEVYTTLRELEDKNRKINFTIESLPQIQGDRSMLRQVAVNLISNALKYTRSKDEANIHIGLIQDNPEKAIYIKDNGVGFDMRYQNKLFGVFQRLHGDTEFEGTGVGLAIAYRIIQKHGGRIWGEGIPNEGATFYFTFKPNFS